MLGGHTGVSYQIHVVCVRPDSENINAISARKVGTLTAPSIEVLASVSVEAGVSEG